MKFSAFYCCRSSDKLHRITNIILVKTHSKSSHSLSGSTLISPWDLFWDLTSTYMILVISLANSCGSAVHYVSGVCSVWQAAAPVMQPLMATNTGHQTLDTGTSKWWHGLKTRHNLFFKDLEVCKFTCTLDSGTLIWKSALYEGY